MTSKRRGSGGKRGSTKTV